MKLIFEVTLSTNRNGYIWLPSKSNSFSGSSKVSKSVQDGKDRQFEMNGRCCILLLVLSLLLCHVVRLRDEPWPTKIFPTLYRSKNENESRKESNASAMFHFISLLINFACDVKSLSEKQLCYLPNNAGHQ